MVGRGALGLGFRDWAVSRVCRSSFRNGRWLWSAGWNGARLVRRGQGGPGHVGCLVCAAAAGVDASYWAVGRIDRSSLRNRRLQWSAGWLGGRGSRAWLVRRGQGGPGHVGRLVCAAAAGVDASNWTIGRVNCSALGDGSIATSGRSWRRCRLGDGTDSGTDRYLRVILAAVLPIAS